MKFGVTISKPLEQQGFQTNPLKLLYTSYYESIENFVIKATLASFSLSLAPVSDNSWLLFNVGS